MKASVSSSKPPMITCESVFHQAVKICYQQIVNAGKGFCCLCSSNISQAAAALYMQLNSIIVFRNHEVR